MFENTELGGFPPREHKTTKMRITWVGCLGDHQHGRVIDEKEKATETGKQPPKGRLRSRKECCPKGKGKGDVSKLGGSSCQKSAKQSVGRSRQVGAD